jgi:hypothetical protein
MRRSLLPASCLNLILAIALGVIAARADRVGPGLARLT